MTSKCTLVGAGEFLAEYFKCGQEEYLIAVDGGYSYLKELGMKPHLILGDFDSIPNELRDTLFDNDIEKVQLPCEKDETDMYAALRYAINKGYSQISIYGATGGRLDHTVANFQTLLWLKQQGISAIIYDKNEEYFMLSNESVEFQPMKGRMSLFAVTPVVEGVTLSGFKYCLEGGELHNNFPLGVSNEFMGTNARIQIGEGIALVMIAKE